MTPALATTSPDATRRPGWKVWTLFSPLIGWLLLFVIAPTLILGVYSFFYYDGNSQVRPGFTLEHYRTALSGVYLYNFFTSSLYAAGTTILCVVIGYPVAYFIGRSSPQARNRLLMLVMIPFLTSFLIRTFAWVAILDQNGVLNRFLRLVHVIPGLLGNDFEILYTRKAIMITLVYTYLPFMILPIYGSVEKLDQSLIEAASDLGASPMKAFWRVIFPLTMPGISAGALMVFVPAVAMFAVTHVMSGGKIQLIGDKIEDQFLGQAGNIPFGSALGMVLLIAFIVTFYLFTRRNEGAEAASFE